MPDKNVEKPSSYEGNLRSALVGALFIVDKRETFHLDTTPEEDILFKASLGGDVAHIKQLLETPSFVEAALTKRDRPYGLTKLALYNLRIMNTIAAKFGHALIVEYLLSIAQQRNIIDQFFIDRDTINAAISSDNVEVFRKLITVVPSCANYDLEYGGYPLNRVMLQYQRAPANTLKTIALLLENGAHPNQRFGPFRSYGANISNASRKAQLDVVRLLIEHGAHVLDSGAIQAAVSKSQIEVLDLLLEHGADVNERPKLCLKVAGRGKPEEEAERGSETPLHVAVRDNQLSAAKWLLEHGADASIQDCHGRTPLEAAIEGNKSEIIGVLIEFLGSDSK